MAKGNHNVATKPQAKKTIDKFYCRKCMKNKAASGFYEATNPMLDSNGLLSICKDCCQEIYNKYFSIYGTMPEAIHNTCRDLDIRYSEHALEQAQSHIESLLASGRKAEAIFGYYKSKLSTLAGTNEATLSFRYKDSDVLQNDNKNEIDSSLIEDENYFEITNDIVRFWGKGKDAWEYEFLDREMTKITASFECPDYSMEMLMRDICFVNLSIERIRQGIDKGDVAKLIKTRSELMNDANMKPVQATGAEANDQVTFSTLIKKWENEKPIPVNLDDEMKQYIDTFMVGHLAKMEGLTNTEAVRKYEDAISEYTINFADINKYDEDV